MPKAGHAVFEIGEWRVDPLAHTLTNDAGEFQVPAKVMAVLVHLANNHDRLVTRQELIDVVWEGNGYVGDKSLNNAIWRIRRVFGDDTESARFIRTTPKTGYQLVQVPKFDKAEGGESSKPGRWNFAPRYGLSIGIVLVLGITAALLIHKADAPQRQFEEALAVVTQMPGRELYAAPTPDGSMFAFMHVSQQGTQDLYLQSLMNPGGQPVKFSASGYSNFAPTWAPDGRHLGYIRVDDKSGLCEIIVRDIELSTEEEIEECVDVDQRTLSWSPDGQWLVYRKDDADLGAGLYLKAMNAEFRPTEELSDRRISCADCLLIDQEVSWSPDSRFLAVTRTKNQMSENVYRFDIDGWKFTQLTYGEPSIEGHTWDKFGENLLYVSDKHSLDRQMWVVNSLTKDKRAIGYDGAGFPVYLPNYEAVLFYRRRARSYIAAIGFDEREAASAFPSVVIQTSGSDRNPSYSQSANKLAYHSNISGHNEIWVADPDGSNRQQLTHLKSEAIEPSWSPGGDKIAFLALDSNTESTRLSIYDLRTNSISSIATGFGDHGAPTWARDSRSLIVPIWRGAETDLWRVAIDGNQLTRITTDGGKFGRESVDGRYIYFTKVHRRGLFRRSAATGAESLVIDDILSSGFGNWSWAGSDRIIYSRHANDHSEIVRFDLLSGSKHVLAKHPGRIVHRFGMLSYSDQHRQLFFTHREPQQIDIMMAPDPLAGAEAAP